MSTLDDYVIELREDLLMESPFVESEITDRIIHKAIQRSIGKMDMFRPHMIRVHGRIDHPDYTMMRTYTQRFDDNSMYNFNDELGTDIGDAYVYAKKWNLDDLLKSPAHASQFRDLVSAYSCMYMANYRRTAGFSNTPFDLKGDQFFQEYKDKFDKHIETIQNTTQNNW